MSTPTPLTPPDADLQDFPFMPLQVARLRDSDFAAEEHPEACWYAVLLWCASWHQVPVASLPDSDAVLMKMVGLGRDVRTWKKHKAGALRGFVTCSDGRLYHPVVAEQALASWQGKLEQRHRTECARIKKANQRNGTDLSAPDFVSFVSERHPLSVPYLSLGTSPNVPEETPSKGQRQGQGERQGDSIEEDDGGIAHERAREAEPSSAPANDFPSDLIALTDELCRTAGVRHVDPNRIIEHQATVREWLAEGIDPEAHMLPAIRQAVASNTERIHSLKWFANPIRQFRARMEAHAHGYQSDRPERHQALPGRDARGRTLAAFDDAFGGLARAQQRDEPVPFAYLGGPTAGGEAGG